MSGPSKRRKGPASIAFESKPEVCAQIPERFADKLSAGRVYLAGTVRFGKRAAPFILTTLRGNPHVVYFRPRGDDPLGDAESFNLSVVPGETPAQDLLFLGGDFNNQRFSAYKRAAPEADTPPAADALPAAARVVVDWMRALRTNDLALLERCYSKARQRSFAKQGWPEVAAEYRKAFKDLGHPDLDETKLRFVEWREQTPSSGRVVLSHGDKPLPPLRVILEDGSWKIDER